ncbi:VWA domain-containing protein [Telmatospirillum sp. J64-1]|uniref:VWA domain-containing protein n=1 Tax=Telmatospirillum sp. J64-1 TaxID=2502183 RepID=UPI00115C9D83|nr:VWA domain-containing protein [Telmatospirillum sp. J64-1]
MTEKNLPAKGEVDAFLNKLASAPKPAPGPQGRLIFAMDATASRQHSWDRAVHIQAEMFQETKSLGGLLIQLAWYRGFGEFQASPWTAQSEDLARRMTAVSCRGGQTQIGRLLDHAIKETGRNKVNALVFVGDAVEENPDILCHKAGQLGLLGVPLFLFHEGTDPNAASTFAEMARLSGGACCRFDASSPQQLRELLSAVAVFAAGGRKALADYGKRRGGEVLRLTHQMGGG